ncbi:MAG: sulfatase-like hydrolase/transferase [Oscillospiraceae bacterium]|nr:sulfatase-like hydrolase/transferase [Oscillospiraceae bacterium]
MKSMRITDLKQNPIFNVVMLLLLGVITGFLSLLLGATTYGLQMFWSYFVSPMVLILNLIPPIILIFLVYFISGRAWIAFTFPSFVVLLLSAVQFFKVQVRGDPFIASDLTIIREAFNVQYYFEMTPNWKLFLSVAIWVGGIVFCILFLKYRQEKPIVRVVGSVSSVVVVAMLFVFVYSDSELYDKTEGGFDASPWSFAERFISRGFMYPFIHSIKYAFPVAPEGFDAVEARRMLDAFECGVIPEERRVNLISIMLESYADLSAFGVLEFKVDVYGPLHALQAESISGMSVNNVSIGKTIDTERLFLTGYTRLSNFGPGVLNYFRYVFSEHFTSSVNSYVHYLNAQGFHTEGYAAVAGWFYDRASVNRHLGFKSYYFLEHFEDSDQSDEFFFQTVQALYEARDRNVPYFSFNLSAQNHGPYDSTGTWEPYLIAQGDLSDEAFFILNNYLHGIFDTTWRLSSFIGGLRHDPEPVVVVVVGDHMPWMGNDGFVFNELGINVDLTTQEGFLNFHSTPFIIWANYAAREMLGNDFRGDGGSFSPSFLMGEVFSQLSWEGDSYMQALRELKAVIDVVSATTGAFRENGVLTPVLSSEAAGKYRDFRMIEHYWLNNFAPESNIHVK